MVFPLPAQLTGVILAVLLSAVLTRVAIGYARRRALLDLPGRRRSHLHATARGGGIALVLVVLTAVVVAHLLDPGPAWRAFGLGLAAVALIGWVDDHRPLSARVRLLVHLGAAALFVASLPHDTDASTPIHAGFMFALRVFLLVTAINFFNFIDGINGLLTSQAAWIAAVAAVLFAAAGQDVPAWLAAVVVAACIGFLPFNFPRARIFLGDVGSGGLGFACGALLLWVEASGAANAWLLLVVASAIGIDAGLTLASRMLRGRRWYTAHREHLYQWMVRSGFGHTSTTLSYLGWNLMLVLPVLWLSHAAVAPAPLFAAGLGLVGATFWWVGKRRALRRVRRRVAR
jgi:UDP-N-acetylmuramyl pentapeptide phosphotransferase/UDP-N-acetylglucosamine-1-phosphate transferase